MRRNGIISYNRYAFALIISQSRGQSLGKPWGVENSLPFRKKALYYGLMLLLTVLALEGMARIAYYAAYGQGYGSGNTDLPVNSAYPPPIEHTRPEPFDPWLIGHPYYGFTPRSPSRDLNAMPPLQRREDIVVVGLLGGSVAAYVKPFLERALRHYFAAGPGQRQPAVLGLAPLGGKQPQQAIIVVNSLQLGGEFDLIVNLDGFNELAGSVGRNVEEGVVPFFPLWWNKRVGLTAAEALRAGQIGLLRREQARLAQNAAASPLRRSAVFGLASRYRQERTAAEIIRLNHELAAMQSAYSLEQRGPRSGLEGEGAALAAARVWYRGSLALARLAELAGADYYHFLQPNQYAPGSKPLSAAERELAYDPLSPDKSSVEKGYPLLAGFGRDLQRQGVNYFDLTGIFAAHPETLYIDQCCHLNERGMELLAAEMTRLMAPALRRRGRARPPGPVSALAAAWPPAGTATRLADGYFQVYLEGKGQWLRYVRSDCGPEDVAPGFILHLTPRNYVDLPPDRREHGFDNRDFSFAAAGGRLWQGQCMALIPLPDYPIAYLRAGQYTADAGEIWVAEYAFPE